MTVLTIYQLICINKQDLCNDTGEQKSIAVFVHHALHLAVTIALIYIIRLQDMFLYMSSCVMFADIN